MRILHVNKFLHRRGGAEAYVLDLAERQEARGDQVALFGMAHPDNPPLPYQALFPSEVVLDPPPRRSRRARAVGRMLWSPAAARGIGEVVRRFRPDVAHLHNVYHQLSPSVVAALDRAGVPIVMTLHDYKLVCPSYQLLAQGRICEACVGGSVLHTTSTRCKDGSLGASVLLSLESALHRRLGAYRPVARFVAPSRFLAERVQRGGVASERVTVLPNFVDLGSIPRATPSGSIVAYVGRLSPEKGLDVLLRAVARTPTVRLEIAGDGPERPALEALARELAPGRISFLGRLDRRGVVALLHRSLATCLPARWHENQPIAVLESLGAGIPVVTTDLGGLPEIVRDGETGLVVPAEDDVALAGALAQLVEQPDRAAHLGSQGRAAVAARHDAPRHLAGLDRIYAAVGASTVSPTGGVVSTGTGRPSTSAR